MCGIAGYVAIGGRSISKLETDAAVRISNALAHRGPDAYGSVTRHNTIMVHRRLTILDPDSRSSQPFCDSTGRITIAFGGEIYNYRELRRELESRGRCFRTQGDVEVLAEAFSEWGLSAICRLRGMYAFAAHDASTGTVTLARDPFGKKPLHYFVNGEQLAYASEIAPLLMWPGVPREPDFDAIAFYLSFGYCPTERTAFAGIRRVKPGHYLELSPDGSAREHPHWIAPSIDPALAERSRDALIGELEERLNAAVSIRMNADVPVGALLSGGLDSSAVAMSMAGQSAGPIKTFSLGFEHPDFDETRYARQVAETLGADHMSFIAGPGAVSDLPLLIWRHGEPFGDPSSLATHAIAREARHSVGVCLTGDGGDETLLGYSRYFRFANLHRDHKAGTIPPTWSQGSFFEPSLFSRDLYHRLVGVFSEPQRLEMCGPTMAHTLLLSPIDELGSLLEDADDSIEAASRVDLRSYLPGAILPKVDIATMSNGLEARSPFLDVDFASWCLSLPGHVRVGTADGGKAPKALLRSLVSRTLPEIAERDKHGFSVPVDDWLRGPLRHYALELLHPSEIRRRGLFNAKWVETLVSTHMSRDRPAGRQIWALMCLELWHRTFIDQPLAGPLEALSVPSDLNVRSVEEV